MIHNEPEHFKYLPAMQKSVKDLPIDLLRVAKKLEILADNLKHDRDIYDLLNINHALESFEELLDEF